MQLKFLIYTALLSILNKVQVVCPEVNLEYTKELNNPINLKIHFSFDTKNKELTLLNSKKLTTHFSSVGVIPGIPAACLEALRRNLKIV